MQPTATVHTPQLALPQVRARGELLSGVPTRSGGAQLPVSFVQARGGDSTPIDTRFATILVRTRCKSTSDQDLAQ